MNNYSEKVLEFARKAHTGQKRNNTGEDYINHPIAVSEIAVKRYKKSMGIIKEEDLLEYSLDMQSKINQNIEIIKSISFLHDCVEDCDVSIRDIEFFLFELGLDVETKNIISDSIDALTKKKENFDIINYLYNIKYTGFARLVKLADLEHNMSDLKPGNLLDKYKLCVYYLEN